MEKLVYGCGKAWKTQRIFFSHFVVVTHRAMLCIHGTSHGPVSVRPFVTDRSFSKTPKRIELVLACELPSTRPTLC